MSAECNRGKVPGIQGQLEAYRQVLEREPSSRVFAPFALALLRAGKAAEAEQVCQEGLRHNPDFSDGHLALGCVLSARRRLKEALEHLDRALELNPHSADALVERAKARALSGDIDAAVGDCMRALDLTPGHRPARQLLSKLGRAKRRAAAPARQAGFRNVAPTAPSRRSLGAQGMHQELGDVSDEAVRRIDGGRQPFRQESEGSGLGQRRAKAGRRAEPEDILDRAGVAPEATGGPAGELPPRPTPDGTGPNPGRSAVSAVATSQLPLVHVVQSVIDRVGGGDPPRGDERLRVSRSGGLVALAGLLVFLLAVVAVVWLAVGRGGGSATGAAGHATAGTLPSQKDAGGRGR